VGTHTLSTTFTPTDSVDYKSVNAVATLVVNQATTVTKLTFTTPITFGSEQAANFMVTVTSPGGATPTGGVAVYAGTKKVCVAGLGNTGHGTCTLTAKQLKAGTYKMSAKYLGNANLKASKSAVTNLVVNP
jgi:hypothetical protein